MVSNVFVARPYMVIRTYREHEPSIMSFEKETDVHSYLFDVSTTDVKHHLRATFMPTSQGVAFMLEALRQTATTYRLFYFVNGHNQPRYPEGF